MLSNRQFHRTRRLALALTGIELLERHGELIERRGRRIGIHDSAEMEALLHAVEAGESTASQRFLGLLTTRFTGFFRHPRHFDIAVEHTRRAVRERGTARLWSAAAATGEEPWSLAMAMIEACESEDPPVRILATDIDAGALTVARQGEYREAALASLPPARRERFFSRSNAGQHWRVKPAVRRLVEFHALNLIEVEWFVTGPFDVIVCRNVLMYLEAGHRYAVLERMASLLAPDGVLMLDPAEYLGNAAHLFTAGGNGTYARRRSLGAGMHHEPPLPPPRLRGARMNFVRPG